MIWSSPISGGIGTVGTIPGTIPTTTNIGSILFPRRRVMLSRRMAPVAARASMSGTWQPGAGAISSRGRQILPPTGSVVTGYGGRLRGAAASFQVTSAGMAMAEKGAEYQRQRIEAGRQATLTRTRVEDAARRLQNRIAGILGRRVESGGIRRRLDVGATTLELIAPGHQVRL